MTLDEAEALLMKMNLDSTDGFKRKETAAMRVVTEAALGTSDEKERARQIISKLGARSR